MRRSHISLFVLLLGLPTGCYTGNSADSRGGPGADGSADAGDAGEGGSDSGTDGADETGSDTDGPPAGECHGFERGMRRLSLREYERTLQELLGDVSIGEGFPSDDKSLGFDSDAGLLPVTDVWLAAHDAIAEDALAVALAAGSPKRAEILTCAPASAAEESSCAEEILSAFAYNAWRRPIEADELASLVSLIDVAKGEGEGFDEGIVLALQAVLLSPHFVFKVEEARPEGERVDDYELATRLAFFLWSAPPDDALLAAAAAGDLATTDGVAAEVDRMLADPRASELIDGFGAQWLELEKLEAFLPLPEHFPDYNTALGEAMGEQTRLTLTEALAADTSLAEFIASPQMLVNETLAEHYGIPGIVGEEFQVVDGSQHERYGLLTHGAILALSSHANRSSPTRRGLWVTERLLCTSPPPAPPDVDNSLPEPDNTPGGQTIREYLEENHLQAADCSGCHMLLDPVGFALENYDGAGAWRTEYGSGAAVDPSAEVPGVGPVDGPAGLAQGVAQHPGLATCVASYAVAYGTNRTKQSGDECMVADTLDGGQIGMRSLFEQIATHPSFAAAAVSEED